MFVSTSPAPLSDNSGVVHDLTLRIRHSQRHKSRIGAVACSLPLRTTMAERTTRTRHGQRIPLLQGPNAMAIHHTPRWSSIVSRKTRP